MQYFKRDPVGVPHEVQQIYAKHLFAKGVGDALGHGEGHQPDADHSSTGDLGGGNRIGHVVRVINKLFAEIEAQESEEAK